jgi:hypothetical protein
MHVNVILTKALKWGGLYCAVVAVVGALIGWLVAGERGLIAAIFAAGMTIVFLGLTAASMIVANRVAKNGMNDPGIFFGIVLGTWFLKLIIFFITGIALRGAPWFDPVVFGATVIIAVLGTLVIDLVTVVRSRTPDIEVELPQVTDDSDRPEA